MPMQILTHTPHWVFAVFALLLWLGGRQLFAGRAHLNRIVAMPAVMGVFAVWGIVNAFGRAPDAVLALLAWAAAAGLTIALVLSRPLPAGIRYDAARREFVLPGSALPLVLMMGIFMTKYAVGVTLAMHPEYASHGTFAIGISALYGVFSGGFAGRSLRLLALRGDRAVQLAATA